MDTLIQTLRRKKSDKRSDPFDDHGERQLTDHEVTVKSKIGLKFLKAENDLTFLKSIS